MVPENPEAGESGLVGVLALAPSGDLDLVELESDDASESSVSVCGTCLYPMLVALWCFQIVLETRTRVSDNV